MPAAALASALGISTPKTVAQLPFSLWVNGTNDLIAAGIDIDSLELNGLDAAQPDTFVFVITDLNNQVGSKINQQDEVWWWDWNQPTNPLFHGYVKLIEPVNVGPYGVWKVTCNDVSEVLDFTPVPAFSRPAESDQARIMAMLGNFAKLTMTGGQYSGGQAIQVNAASLPAENYSSETGRSFIERVLSEASPVTDYHIDAFGNVHTGTEVISAPFNISDNPDGVTTIAGVVDPIYDGASDVDFVYVRGGSDAGSGYVWGSNAPRSPARGVTIDAPQSLTAATCAQVGAAEIAQRQKLIRVNATVWGYDGWQKGQTVQVTNAVYGWSARSFVIRGITMHVLSGNGLREYKLVLNTPEPSLIRSLSAAIAQAAGATAGPSVVGQLGGSTSGPAATNQPGVQTTQNGLEVVDASGVSRATLGLLPSGEYGLALAGSSLSGEIGPNPPAPNAATAGAQLTSNGLEVADGSVIRATLGKLGPSSYGMRIVSSDGTTVIIDGTSSVFRIQASGNTSATAAASSSGASTITLTGLGALAATPAHNSFVSGGNTNADQQFLGFMPVGKNDFAAASSGGAANDPFVAIYQWGYWNTQLNGSSQCQVVLSVVNQGISSLTLYGKYYILFQTAL